MVVSSCGSSKESSTSAGNDVTVVGALSVATPSDLPTCNPSRTGAVYYVQSSQQFFYCDSKANRVLDLALGQGKDGISALVELRPATVGQCPAGGVVVRVGLDANRDGALQDTELRGQQPVCNGRDGSSGSVTDHGDGTKTVACTDGTTAIIRDGSNAKDGSNGHDSLVKPFPDPPGANCALGGQRLDVGTDNGDGNGIADNGVLEAGEVDVTTYVCSTTGSTADAGVPDSGGGSDADGGDAPVCPRGPDDDVDGDGFTIAQGDCNDCDPMINPGAIELPTETGHDAVDENCDGRVDEPIPNCDDDLLLADVDPLHAARALELCEVVSDGSRRWGLIDAKYVTATGAPLVVGVNVGITGRFGMHAFPQRGARMLGLSTGAARTPGQAGYCSDFPSDACMAPARNATLPASFPDLNPSCPVPLPAYDDVALEIRFRAPTNAYGFSFWSALFSADQPHFSCAGFSDEFITLMEPKPANAANGNIAFDILGNRLAGDLTHWSHCSGNNSNMCELGVAFLAGTGFEAPSATEPSGGSTGWLLHSAPVVGGQIVTLRFAIWDGGDKLARSTVLLDAFEWATFPAH